MLTSLSLSRPARVLTKASMLVIQENVYKMLQNAAKLWQRWVWWTTNTLEKMRTVATDDYKTIEPTQQPLSHSV